MSIGVAVISFGEVPVKGMYNSISGTFGRLVAITVPHPDTRGAGVGEDRGP